MGTPEFAVPSLEILISEGHDICGVFTQADKPKNRGMAVTPPPVKECALTHRLDVYQPDKLGSEAVDIIKRLSPELIVVVAYGKMLPQEIISFPKYGCINIHASILPKYRGAAPIAWAVLNGERETGVTAMYMAEEMDSGDIIEIYKTSIGEEETTEELYHRLKDLGAELLRDTIKNIAAGKAKRTPQDESQVTYAPKITKSMAPIDWEKPAEEIINHIRGLIPWPVATAEIFGKTLKVYKAVKGGNNQNKPHGTVVSLSDAGIEISCKDSTVIIKELQPEGKRRMKSADYLRGLRL